MSWTKRQLINQSMSSIGLAQYVYDLTAEQYQEALHLLDALVALWNANGIRLGFPLPTNPDNSDIDQDSGLPDWAIVAAYSNLAMMLAPIYGKQVPDAISKLADASYGNMVNQASLPIPERQLPQTMPRGSGTKPWRNYNNPFLNPPSDPVDAGSDGPIELD